MNKVLKTLFFFFTWFSRNAQVRHNQEINENNLTSEIIDSTLDKDLLQVVYDNIYNRIPINLENEIDFITRHFSKPQQVIFLIWQLEMEVNNGGFDQFYLNSSRQFAEFMPEVLKTVNAFKFSELCVRANEGFKESFTLEQFDELDQEFYKLYEIEDLNDLQVAFIRKNKKDFLN